MEAGKGEDVRELCVDDLPIEILQLMFVNLWEEDNDVPSILISMLVCKKWHEAITCSILSRLSAKTQRELFKNSAFARGVAMAGNIRLLQWGRDGMS
jgi:hypothetical protein